MTVYDFPSRYGRIFCFLLALGNDGVWDAQLACTAQVK